MAFVYNSGELAGAATAAQGALADSAIQSVNGLFGDSSGAVALKPGNIGSAYVFDTYASAVASITGGARTLWVLTTIATPNNLTSGYPCAYVRDDNKNLATAAFVSEDGFAYVPSGTYTPLHYGALGIKNRSGNTTNGYLLSDVYGSLAEAQAVYPKALALTETIDSHAIQKMIDALRDDSTVISSGADSTVRQQQTTISYYLPTGCYVVNRMIDATMIEGAHAFWHFVGDRAVILNQVIGGYAINLLGSRRGYFHGFSILGDWLAAGVPRGGMLFGRPGDTSASDSHMFGAVHINGRHRLAGVHMMASEEVKLGGLKCANVLDKRQHTGAYDGGGAGTFDRGEAVTWSGGTGVLSEVDDDGATGTMTIKVLTGTLADNVVFTGSSSTKTATVNGALTTEPSGEGANGESYSIVFDGDNYWGTEADSDPGYTTHAAQNVGYSQLQIHGAVDMRHTGWGCPVWICGAETIDLGGSYMVSTARAAVVLHFDVTTEIPIITLPNHYEAYATAGDIGVQQGVRIDATTGGTNVTISAMTQKNKNGRMEAAQFQATANVASVTLYYPDIIIEKTGQDNGQVLFDPPAKFTVIDGSVKSGPGFADYLNVADLAAFSGELYTDDVTWAGARHADGGYKLTTPDISGYFGNVKVIIGDDGLGGVRFVDDDGVVQARVQYTGSAINLAFKDGYTMVVNNTTGSLNFSKNDPGDDEFNIGQIGTLQMTNIRDANGVIVLKAQRSVIPLLPTAGTSTVAELETKINALIQSARDMGLNASS